MHVYEHIIDVRGRSCALIVKYSQKDYSYVPIEIITCLLYRNYSMFELCVPRIEIGADYV